MTDDDFLAAFENCTLPFEQWNHRSHVRVAFLYASAYDVESATDRMRAGIKAYNKANRVPESLESGYHETITVAFMRLTCDAVVGQSSSFEDFTRRCPELFDKRMLFRFYSRNRIRSAEAKATFVEPDLGPVSLAALGTVPDQLVIFDVDGTLIQSIGVDDRCFTQAVADVLGVRDISTDWASYKHQTDSGLVYEISGDLNPRLDRTEERVRDHFLHLLKQETTKNGFRLLETTGACEMLGILRHHPSWCVAIATGGWEQPAKLKLRLAGVNVDDIPFASSDDAMAREEIIERSIDRAEQQYGQNGFNKVVYVGDAEWDLMAARKLGIGFVGVTVKPFSDNGVSTVHDFAKPTEFVHLLDSAEE
jgi:phosphoglycolate phosphatase-like HAD superfamily hydrolase